MASYNGWANWETWAANLWVGGYLEECRADGVRISPDYVRYVVEEMLIVDCQSLPGLARDILHAAIEEINYREIASHFEEETAA